MTKTPPPIMPHRDMPGFQDLRQGPEEGRALMSTHRVMEDGKVITVLPAHQMVMTGMVDRIDGSVLPSIRMHSALSPVALLFLPTTAETRAGALLTMADDIEDAAKGQADAAIARAMKGEG